MKLLLKTQIKQLGDGYKHTLAKQNAIMRFEKAQNKQLAQAQKQKRNPKPVAKASQPKKRATSKNKPVNSVANLEASQVEQANT